ncbi:AAA family ATPase [Bradyrhizobium sp.]
MQIWIDLLLTDSWSIALFKLAQVTIERYPEIRLEPDMVRQKVFSIAHNQRSWCRHMARRTRLDPDGIDLGWLMLAADPSNAAVTYNFVDRLGDRLVAWAQESDDVIPDSLLINRLDRWSQIRDGQPARVNDPFAAVSDAVWIQAGKVARDDEKEDDAASSGFFYPLEVKKARQAAREREEAGLPSLQVIDSTTTTLKDQRYKALAAATTALTVCPEVRPVADALRAEFPHAAAAIEMMLVDLREGEPLAFRPFVLLGEPGCGKSRLLRRMAEHLGAKLRRYDGASSSDNAFGGTPKRWANAAPCFPLMAVAEFKVANPIVMVDEIDKAGIGYYSGSLGQALMPFLEKETASAYPDIGLDIEANLSAVNYCMTANDDTKLPSPLRDRCRIIRVPSPDIEHLPGLAAAILRDIAVDQNIDPRWLAPLAGDELDVVARAWSASDRSVRKLQKIISATVTARTECAVRH